MRPSTPRPLFVTLYVARNIFFCWRAGSRLQKSIVRHLRNKRAQNVCRRIPIILRSKRFPRKMRMTVKSVLAASSALMPNTYLPRSSCVSISIATAGIALSNRGRIIQTSAYSGSCQILCLAYRNNSRYTTERFLKIRFVFMCSLLSM